MKILVTGGLGAVGSYLAPELRSRGHDVWVADLPHKPGPNYIRCDVGEYREVEQIFSGFFSKLGYVKGENRFDFVYHLAAEFGRWNGEDYYERMWRSNAIGTKNIIRMQERHGFRAVYFSSSEVYGDYEGTMTEDVMDKVVVRQINDYALSKWVNESQVQNSAEMTGTESVRVRLFNTYGPGEPYSDYRSVICVMCYRALHGIPFTVYTGHTRTSTYITDMATTLANICDYFHAGEVYNIGGLDYHTIEDAAKLVLKHTGCDPKLVCYSEPEPFTTLRKKVDCTKAVAHLMHDPKVELDEGIEKTVEWMRQTYGVCK